MRVAMIGPLPPEEGGLSAGGVATHTLELVRALSREGVEVHVLATNVRDVVTGSGLPRVSAMRSDADWRALAGYCLSMRSGLAAGRLGIQLVRNRRPPAGWLAGRRLLLAQVLEYRGFLERVQPDLVHVQHPLERHLIVRLLAEFGELARPVVVTLHSFFGEHAEAVIYGLMRPNLSYGDRFIAVNPHVRDEAVQLGVDADRVRVICSGVDTSRFIPRPKDVARRELGLAIGEALVLFVGNLEPRKGVDRLLDAMARLRDRFPNARLAIVGNGVNVGTEDQEPLLRQQAARVGLSEAISFVGRVSADDLVRWYNAADVFALPSTSEAQGIAALEAMSCGTPVVASAVGGLINTITSGKDGLLMPSGDVVALAEGLAEVLTDEAMRRRIGEAARRTVEQRFSWTQSARATLAVYRELVPGPGTAHAA